MVKEIVRAFGIFGTTYLSNYFSPLKDELEHSNLGILYETYVGRMLFFSALAFVAATAFVTISFYFLFSLELSLISGVIAGAVLSTIVITLFHSYPFHLMSQKKKSIESNTPFAINHMAAIAASGVSPFVVFKLLSNIPEYQEVSNESRRIVRNVETFGMDVTSAIRNVAERTPSDEFHQFLYGILSLMDTGGDLKKYLENSAKDALFNYRLKRERYMQTLSTYADFYTAVLIAAPLFFVSVLAIMSLVGGQIFGLNIPDAMRLGIFVLIPIMNVSFILFIHYTQPTL